MLRRPASKQQAEVVDELEDPSSAISFGNKIIFLGFGSFIVWAAMAPLDEGVPSTGVVVVESQRKVVSHISGGTVAEVFVKENQTVKEGDVLLTLSATRAQGAYALALNEYIGAAAKMARLSAEQVFADRVQYPEDVLAYAAEAGRQDIIQAQEHLFRVRRQALLGEQAILQENLAASHGQVQGARQQLAARQQQASLLGQELREMRPLVEEGYAPRNKILEQERQLAELSSVTSDLQARVTKEVSNAAELRLRILQRKQEFLRDVESLLADTRREVPNLREKLAEAKGDVDRTVIVSPASGQVQAMKPLAPGTVVTASAQLLEIVPLGDVLLIDVQIQPHLITQVRPGLATDIRVSAFTDDPQLTIEGKVQSVSSDRHEPTNNQPPFYLARIEVTEKGMHSLHGRQLRPGMSVDAVIKTGERSFLAYLMRPLSKRMFTSLQEP